MTSRYGEWCSPLSAAEAARAGARFGPVHLARSSVMWSESLPSEGGRMAITYCSVPDSAEADDYDEFRKGQVISARSRINEYGGGSFWRSTGDDEFQTFWVDSETQRIMVAGLGGPARSLTPQPPAPRTWRYAAGVLSPDGEWIFAERAMHVDERGEPYPEPVNDLVAVRTGDEDVVQLISPQGPGGGDFVASPKLSPDGRTLAWLRWDHPDMPWDAAELWAATVHFIDDKPSLTHHRRIAGGMADMRSRALSRAVSVCLPEFSPDGHLWWCDDSDDWWHLRRASVPGLPANCEGDASLPVLSSSDEEVGEPRWVSGGCRYGFTDSGEVVFVGSSGGLDALWVADPSTGGRRRVPGPEFSYVESISVLGDRIAAVAGTPQGPTSVWLIDLRARSAVDLRDARSMLEPSWTSMPEPISFDTEGGVECHALLYRPRGGDQQAPEGDLPPLVVRIHGGPTASARSEFSTSVQFWTTRGFAVVDVNYRGSTGFGRRYRDQLRGEWGVADVHDCIAAARYLSDAGVVDPRRCVIRGGSSGGFTALAAICSQAEWGFPDTLAAACSLYGVTDLAALARDTHKFESRYLDGLVGTFPKEFERYAQRSPLHNARKLTKPVLLLQGSEDRIVPQSQAEVLVEAMASRGVPHAYVLFEGEGHGFVNADTLTEALETELAFYGVVLGFKPAGDLPRVELD